MTRLSFPHAIMCVSLVAVVLAGFVTPGAGDTGDPPIVLRLSNEYVEFNLGVQGAVNFKVGDTCRDWVVAGRWALATRGGDPDTTGDNDQNLIIRARDLGCNDDGTMIVSPAHKFGYVKIKVGTDQVFVVGDTGTGGWARTPEVISPPPGLGLGKTGSFIEAEWVISEPQVSVLMRFNLVRDQVRMEYTISNNAAVNRSVGMVLAGVPGMRTKPFIPAVGQVTYGKVLGTWSVPEYIEFYDNLATPVTVARNMLVGQDATKPDYIAVGEASDLTGDWGSDAFTAAETAMWLEPIAGSPTGGFVPDVRRTLVYPSWMLCWAQRTLAPSRTRSVVTYYGVGAASSGWTYRLGSRTEQDSAALAVQGPRALKYDTTDPVRTSDLTPEVFDVTAYVYNLALDPGPYDLQDVSVSIFLPDGLELDAASESRQTIGRVPVSSERAVPISWRVRANGVVQGELEYFVTARDSVTGWNQVVGRKIMIPAVGKNVLRSGWQLMHVPFTFGDSDILRAFGKSAGQIFAQAWDPSGGLAGKYVPVNNLKPGQGFWMYGTPAAVGQFALAADHEIVGRDGSKQSAAHYIDVKSGWNLIGSPYVYPVLWSQAQVYNRSTNVVLSMERAVASGWINGTLFGYNPDKRVYEYVRYNELTMQPWKGYWVRVRTPVTVILTPAVYPSGDVSVSVGG